MNRRIFFKKTSRLIITTVAAFGTLGFWAKLLLRQSSPPRLLADPGVLRPPGAVIESDFLKKCIRCLRCENACQSGAIRIAGPNDAVPLGTPYILPHDKACELLLTCTQACPTGALLPLANAKDVKMGTAVVDERLCVVHNGTGVCGACHTACPFKNCAIVQGSRNAPRVDPNHCVGCGFCEEACIVEGIKAIRVYSGRGVA